jgi:hypothetical protein
MAVVAVNKTAHVKKPSTQLLKKIMKAVEEAKLLFGKMETLKERMAEIDRDLEKEGFTKYERNALAFKYFGKYFSRSQIYKSMPPALKRPYEKQGSKSLTVRHSDLEIDDSGKPVIPETVQELYVPKDYTNYIIRQFAKSKSGRPLILLVDMDTRKVWGVGPRNKPDLYR